MGCVLAVLGFFWKIIKTVIKLLMKIAELIIKMFVGLGLVLPMVAAIILLALWVFGVIIAGTPLFIVLWSLLGVFTLVTFIFKIIKIFRKDNDKNQNDNNRRNQNESNEYNRNDNNRYYQDERDSADREKKKKHWWQ